MAGAVSAAWVEGDQANHKSMRLRLGAVAAKLWPRVWGPHTAARSLKRGWRVSATWRVAMTSANPAMASSPLTAGSTSQPARRDKLLGKTDPLSTDPLSIVEWQLIESQRC